MRDADQEGHQHDDQEIALAQHVHHDAGRVLVPFVTDRRRVRQGQAIEPHHDAEDAGQGEADATGFRQFRALESAAGRTARSGTRGR